MMSTDMPFHTVYAAAVTALLLSLVVLTLFRRIRYRRHVGRELIYLVSQNQYEYTIIDLRNRDDFNRGHIPNARNVPFKECQGYLPTENMFEKIYTYGNNRRSARKAALDLDANGYFSVKYYGAFRGWKGPVEITALNDDNKEQN